jgi:hypothetical protein
MDQETEKKKIDINKEKKKKKELQKLLLMQEFAINVTLWFSYIYNKSFRSGNQ